jgi:hypothetical protein
MFTRSLTLSSVVLCLAALTVQLAGAQTSSFEGFNVHAGLGGISQTIFKSDMVLLSNPQVPVSSPDTIPSAGLLNVGAGYNKAVSDQFTLGLEFNLSARDSKHVHSVNFVGPYALGSTLWNTNQYTLSLAPGYLLAPDTLLYAKFGLLRVTTMCSNDNGQTCVSNHLSGQNLGLGVKQILNGGNNYFYMESNKNQLFSSRLTTVSTPVTYSLNGSSLNLVFGFGYHFH